MLVAGTLLAEVPNRLTYQGRLAKRGVSLSGDHIFVARILDQDGKQLWSSGNITQKLPITGDFALVLEPTGIDWLNVKPSLEISIDGEKFTPNEPFAASPYANAAAIAATVPDGAITNAKLAGNLNLSPEKVNIYGSTTLNDWRSKELGHEYEIDATKVHGNLQADYSQVKGTAVVCLPDVAQEIKPKTSGVSPLTLRNPTNDYTVDIFAARQADNTSVLRVKGDGTTVAKNLHPLSDSTGSLGASGQKWANVYADSITVTNPGSMFGYKVGTFTSSASTGNQSITGVGFKPRLVQFSITIGAGASAYSGTGAMDSSGTQWATASHAATAGDGTAHTTTSFTNACISIETANRADGAAATDLTAHRALDRESAYIATSILSDNSARAGAFGLNSPFHMPFPFAAKTGTTKDYRDNWAVGYTPEWTIGVWVGNFDGKPMRRVSGITGAAPLLHDAALVVAGKYTSSAFIPPSAIREREVCPTSGNIPGPWCFEAILEVFSARHLPNKLCDVHGPEKVIEAATQKRAMIEFPKEGDVFKIDPAVPIESQAVRIRANIDQGPGMFHWWVDSQPIESTESYVWWPLKPGKHWARFVYEKKGRVVRTASVRFLVLP